MKIFGLLLSLTLFPGFAAAQSLTCTTEAGYKPAEGMKAEVKEGMVTLTWPGEDGAQLRASFAIENGQPIVKELAARQGAAWIVLGKDLTPEFQVTTGKRRISSAQRAELKTLGIDTPEEEDRRKWNTFWDAPLTVPGAIGQGQAVELRSESDITHGSSSFQTSACTLGTDGNQLMVTFNGLTLGIFSGDLRFIAYKGTNLLRQEAVASTQQPSVAYIYKAGLKGFPITDSTKLAWRDSAQHQQYEYFGGHVNQGPVNLRARNRMEILDVGSGSLAVFPTPHKFFFSREVETNLGWVYYRKDTANSFALGVMWPEHNEGYHPWGETDAEWTRRVGTSRGDIYNMALFNAPPGTRQRMSVYYYLSARSDEATRNALMAYTHNDAFKPLPGYKTMEGHFHLDFNEQLRERDDLDYQPPWVAVFRSLGINIIYLGDFHDDSDPQDPGPKRFMEQKVYFEGAERVSDKDFLVMPGEEANAFTGGHMWILTSKPIYYSHSRYGNRTGGITKGELRPADVPFEENLPEYGQVYHLGSTADVLRFLNETNSVAWTTHPNTKSSEGYPDAYKDKDFFLSDRWVGASWESLPGDLSWTEECQTRCFDTEDNMNNWSPKPKNLITEGDTYTKWPDDESYSSLAVNYVKLDKTPAYNDDWSPIINALRNNQLFGTNGEVLFHSWGVQGGGASAVYTASIEYTYPLQFADLVWGDGTKVYHKHVSLSDTLPFGNKELKIPFDATGAKWARLSVWDTMESGAWDNPVEIK